MSRRQSRSRTEPQKERNYQWIGEGENRDGALQYCSVQVGDDTFKVGDAAVIYCFSGEDGICHIQELFENIHTGDMEMRVCWYYQLADVVAQFGRKRARQIPSLQDRELFRSDHVQLLSVESISRKAVVIVDQKRWNSIPESDDTYLCQTLLNTKNCSFCPLPSTSASCQREDSPVHSPRKRLRDDSSGYVASGFDGTDSCRPRSPKRARRPDDGGGGSEEIGAIQRHLPHRTSKRLAIAQIKQSFVHKSGNYSATLTTPSPSKGHSTKRLPKGVQTRNSETFGQGPVAIRRSAIVERKMAEMTPEGDEFYSKEGACRRVRKSLRLSTARVVDLVTTEVARDLSYSPSGESVSDMEGDESSQESSRSSSYSDHLATLGNKRKNLSVVAPVHVSTAQKKKNKVKKTMMTTPVKEAATTVDKKKSLAILKERSHHAAVVRGRGTATGQHEKELHSVQTRLHVSSVPPDALPCREEEFESIRNYVETKLFSDEGGCMYISGVPGTGKTATVKAVARRLVKAAHQGEIPSFKFVELNGMQLTEPSQAFVTVLKQLTGQRASASRAAVLLEQYFGRKKKKSRHGGVEGERILLLADELDMLWTRRQSVLYRLFDWPTRPCTAATLIVIAVANTMDLPERIMANRVASRLGPTRLTFHPYTFQQLEEIALDRIGATNIFAPDAIQLGARKVAAVSGDARRALDLCRRATELAQQHHQESLARPGKTTSTRASRSSSHKVAHLVEMKHINQAVQEMCSSPMMVAIRKASRDEKMFLRAVMVEFQRTGLEETNMKEVYHQFSEICQLEDIPHPSLTAAYQICQRLWNMGVLLVEGVGDLYRRIRVYMNADDVLFALRQDK